MTSIKAGHSSYSVEYKPGDRPAPGNCVLIHAMKKLLLGCLLLFACQPATATPPAQLSPTAALTATLLPATETPVPTATQTPAPTVTAFPRFFSDDFNTLVPGWTVRQSGSDAAPAIKTENSNLILQMDAPFVWAYAVYNDQTYDSVRVDARFANQAGSPASIGLICRYSERDGWFEYNVSTDGTYNVLYGQWLAEGIADYLPILSAASSAILPSGTAQEIGLVCSGTMLSLLIDQNVIRNVDVSRYELIGGNVGVTASSFENTPVIAAFDWVRVSEP
jgi:hypothetical protein